MKKLVLSFFLLLPMAAQADYFGCTLTRGTERQDVEAEYRGRQVQAEEAGVVCSAYIDRHAVVFAQLIDTNTHRVVQKSGRGTQELILDAELSCRCGLR